MDIIQKEENEFAKLMKKSHINEKNEVTLQIKSLEVELDEEKVRFMKRVHSFVEEIEKCQLKERVLRENKKQKNE